MDTSGVTNPAPEAVYQTYAYATYGVGNQIAWSLPVPDGSYTLRLHFTEPDFLSPGNRTFDIVVDGTLLADNYDIRAAAGAALRAVAPSFAVTASGGNGLTIQLINQTVSYTAILSGIELTAVNPGGVAVPTVDLAYSSDGGSNWNAIASNLRWTTS